MANPKFTKNIQQGLLDRLIDTEPLNRQEAPMSRAESLRQFRMAVKRDLEWLLNTTRMPIEIPDALRGNSQSVLFFGLPDIASISLQNPGDEADACCVRWNNPLRYSSRACRTPG